MSGRDLTGQRFGRLLVLSKADGKPGRWNCLCDCGNEKVVYGSCLVSGSTKSCGCYRRELHMTHGMYHTRLRGVWAGMIQRCNYDKHIDNKWYKQNGITVCDEWRNSFQAFHDWAVANGYKDGLSIDRIDNAKGYNPDNCRFATPKEQACNRTNNIMITYHGRTQPLKVWTEELGLNYHTVYCRMRKGKSFEQAIVV